MSGLRHALRGVLLLGILGLLAELFFEKHTKPGWMLVPLVVLGLSLVCLMLEWVRPVRLTRRLLALCMVLLIAAGGAGLYLHHQDNREWELDRTPNLAGWELTYRSLFGAVPSLAPGALVPLGLLGLVTLGADSGRGAR